MFKLFMMIIAFVKELFINNKNEINILHHQFSFKKSLKFLVVILSFVLNYLLIHALINVTNKYNHIVERNMPIKSDSHYALVNDLHDELHACQQQVIDVNVMLSFCNDRARKKEHPHK